MFNDEKWGYNKKEIDTFITKQKAEFNATLSDLRAQNIELKAELEEKDMELKKYKLNEDSIKDAMILAAKKNKEIETQAARDLKIECDKIKKLYYKWVDIIDAVRKKYGLINIEELNERRFYLDIEKLFDNSAPQKFMVKNNPEQPQIEKQNYLAIEEQKIHHKQLLSRMSGLLHSVSTSVKEAENRKFSDVKPSIVERHQEAPKQTTKTVESDVKSFAESEYEKESERLKTITPSDSNDLGKNMIKPIAESNGSLKGYSSLLDKYLSDNEDDDDLGAYGKILTQSTTDKLTSDKQKSQIISHELNIPHIEVGKSSNGFDLKEAVNPKDSLEDIMQAFDI